MSNILFTLSKYLGWYAYKQILRKQNSEITALRVRNSWLEYHRKYTLYPEIEHLYNVLRARQLNRK